MPEPSPVAAGHDAERTLEALVERLRADPHSPSLSLRTNEGDRYAVGDGRPVVSAPRAAMIAWLSTGDASGIEAPDVTDLPALPPLTGEPCRPRPTHPEVTAP